MSTRFPLFESETIGDLWFSVDKPRNEEADLQAEEQKYENWLTSIIKKDSDTPYIGEAVGRYSGLNPGEDDTDDESDDSNEEMEDDDLNELPDSPDEQVIPEIDMDNGPPDNSWMNNNN